MQRRLQGGERFIHLLTHRRTQWFQCIVHTTTDRRFRRGECVIHLELQGLANRLDYEIGLLTGNACDLVMELSDHGLERMGNQRLQAEGGG